MGESSKKKADLVSYRLIYVGKVWYTQCKGNRLVESGPIELEEFKDAFLGKYFPCERRDIKVED